MALNQYMIEIGVYQAAQRGGLACFWIVVAFKPPSKDFFGQCGIYDLDMAKSACWGSLKNGLYFFQGRPAKECVDRRRVPLLQGCLLHSQDLCRREADPHAVRLAERSCKQLTF